MASATLELRRGGAEEGRKRQSVRPESGRLKRFIQQARREPLPLPGAVLGTRSAAMNKQRGPPSHRTSL